MSSQADEWVMGIRLDSDLSYASGEKIFDHAYTAVGKAVVTTVHDFVSY